MTAARRCVHVVCVYGILLLRLCHRGGSETLREEAYSKEAKLATLALRGQNSHQTILGGNNEYMTNRMIAKMSRARNKEMKILSRKRKQDRMRLDRIRTNSGDLMPKYDSQPYNMNPPQYMEGGQYGSPSMEPPPMMETGHYGQYGKPPPLNDDEPPPPRPPPPTWEEVGIGYGPSPNMVGPPPQPMWEPVGWKRYGSKSSKAHNRNGNMPLNPGYPVYRWYPPDNPFPPGGPFQFPPDNQFPPGPPFPPFPTPGRPTYMPTYMPTESTLGQTIKITIEGLMNTYGIMLPLSHEEYNHMVTVLEQTIMDTARAPLGNNQKVSQVKVLEIEGITSQLPGDSQRGLQNVDSNSFGGDIFQCTFNERKQCCARDPPDGAGNPAQYCESIGCNINTCRRVRFDIVAEQLLVDQGRRNLQSITDTATQNIVNDLYTTITEYMIKQVNNGSFTNSLRANIRYCGDLCVKTMADATATDVVFGPPMDIMIATPTLSPTRFPTRRPTRKPTPKPTTKTMDPTLYPTRNPTLFPTLYPTIHPVSSVMILEPTPPKTFINN